MGISLVCTASAIKNQLALCEPFKEWFLLEIQGWMLMVDLEITIQQYYWAQDAILLSITRLFLGLDLTRGMFSSWDY